MFCTKCGTELPDDASFCTNCGAKLAGGDSSKPAEKVVDNDIVLNVKPTFSFGYKILSPLIVWVFLFLILCLPTLLSGEISIFLAILLVYAVIVFLFTGIPLIVTKIQYKHYSYDFYKTKVIYKDSFLNVSEKEVKYKYIREVTLQQTFVQRWFNIGNIILFTNAESGYGNGIFIRDVKDVKDVYTNIKQIINV